MSLKKTAIPQKKRPDFLGNVREEMTLNDDLRPDMMVLKAIESVATRWVLGAAEGSKGDSRMDAAECRGSDYRYGRS